ncbi:hypothetical protein WDV93_19040 [Pantoea ananatis]
MLLSTRSKQPGTPAKNTKAATKATSPGLKGGYFPVPPVDSSQDIRSAMCLTMEQMGLVVEAHITMKLQQQVRTKWLPASVTMTKKADEISICQNMYDR